MADYTVKTGNIDAGTKSPASARPDLYDNWSAIGKISDAGTASSVVKTDASGNITAAGGGTYGGDVLIKNTSTTGFKIQDGLENDVLTVDTDTFSGRVVIAPGVSFENNVSTSQDPANDLGVTMQWISNTSLRIKMKGDDGVVRSVDLTLS